MAMCVRACCHSCEVLETSTGNPRGRDDIGKWMYKEKSRPKDKLKGTCKFNVIYSCDLGEEHQWSKGQERSKEFQDLIIGRLQVFRRLRRSHCEAE